MSKFEIEILSYFDRNELVAEIYYDCVQWAEISPEKKTLIVKFYSHPSKEYWEFSCHEAVEALEQAKNKLLKRIQEKSFLGERVINSEQINQQGQQLLEKILSDPQAKTFSNRFGGNDIFEPSGKGARFDSKGDFLGFLQSR